MSTYHLPFFIIFKNSTTFLHYMTQHFPLLIFKIIFILIPEPTQLINLLCQFIIILNFFHFQALFLLLNMRQIIALYVIYITVSSQVRLHSQTMCQKLSTTLLGTSYRIQLRIYIRSSKYKN